MVSNVLRSKIIIYFTLLLALVLQVVPWPGNLDLFRPSWLLLVTFYWVLALPHRVSVGTAFILGVLWDLLIGSTLGIRGMMMSIMVYIVASNFLVLRNLALWTQAVIISLLAMLAELLIFSGEYLTQGVSFNPLLLWGSVINGILWPWLFLLLRRIRRQWGAQ